MQRKRSVIALVHPRERRVIEFVREGTRLHARGGVWGESDWFEFDAPKADQEIVQEIVQLAPRIIAYLADGFAIESIRIIDPTFAMALASALAPGVATKKPAAKKRATKKPATKATPRRKRA